MRFLIFNFLVIALLLVSGCDAPKYQIVQKNDANGFSYEIVTNDPFKARIYTLKNGLKVYLVRNTNRPSIATFIGVKAGATFEDSCHTGVAHYLEHLMFKGTSEIGTIDWAKEKIILSKISDLFEQYRKTLGNAQKKAIYSKIDSLSQIAASYVVTNEMDMLHNAIGATGVNASTSYESTIYKSVVPKNELERWARLQAERFTNPALRLFHTELETVYEEYNMYQDMDSEHTHLALMDGLFEVHPYNTCVLGRPEHLKAPSMKAVLDFKERYYIPNNMAIALAGDLNFEETIQLIEHYFSAMQRKDLNLPPLAKEKPISTPVVKEVIGPDAEYLNIAFRFDGIGSRDEMMVNLISAILCNQHAGLIDLNLVQQQKVLTAHSQAWFMCDYGLHTISATPRDGMSLEELKWLLLSELDKVKKGCFEDWLIEAIVNQRKVDFMNTLDNPFDAAYSLIETFTNGQSHAAILSFEDELKQITKEEIMAFATEKYQDNFVVVYKRKGERNRENKVSKPEITSVPVNRQLQSSYAKSFLAKNPTSIKPEFINFEEKLNKKTLKAGVEYYHSHNETNALFSLEYVIDIGKYHNKLIPLAVEYLGLIGTMQYSPELLKKELYRYGLEFTVSASDRRCYITISGLDDQLEKGIQLMEHIIHNVKGDQKSFDSFVNRIIEKRNNNKVNPNAILRAMKDYGLYGESSPGKFIVSNDDLHKIRHEDLTKVITELVNYEHKVYYYGSSSPQKVKELLYSYHSEPVLVNYIPQAAKFEMLAHKVSKVYVVDYDISQANIILVAKDKKFEPSIYPYALLFNRYFGDGLSSVVSQEIRESKALAYSAYTTFNIARTQDDYNTIIGGLATQADKLDVATTALLDLMENLPQANYAFQQACESVIKQINTERITNESLFWEYQRNMDRGIDYDVRKDIYSKVQTMTLDEFGEFFNEHIANKQFTYLVMGRKDDMNFSALEKLGTIHELTLEQLFGY